LKQWKKHETLASFT